MSELRFELKSCEQNFYMWCTVAFYTSMSLNLTFNYKKTPLSLCLNNYSKYLFEMETVCLDFFLLAAGSWSLVSDCALSKQRGIAPQPVWTARGAESSEGRFSRFPRTWQINSYSDWNTLSFNWSLGHLNFCLFFFFWNEPHKPQHMPAEMKNWEENIFPLAAAVATRLMGRKKTKTVKTQKSMPAISIVASQRFDCGFDSQQGVFVSARCFPSVTAWASSHGPQPSESAS